MSNLKNRRIALHHAVAMAISDKFQNPGDVVGAAKLFAEFLNDDAALSATEVDAAKIVDRVAQLHEVTPLEIFENTNLHLLGLKKKTVSKLLDYLDSHEYSSACVSDVLLAAPEIFDALGKKRTLEIVAGICRVAEETNLDPLEAVVESLRPHYSPGSENFEEAKVGWATLIAFTRVEDGACPGCGQVHDEMPLPMPHSPVADFFSEEGTAILANKGIHTFVELVQAGPVVMMGLPEMDIEYLHGVMGRVLSQGATFVPMVNGYAKLPLNSFADVDSALVEHLNNRGIHTIADTVANSDNLQVFTTLASMPTFPALVGHLITALNKEVEENQELSVEQKQDITDRLSGLKTLLNKLIEVRKNATIRNMNGQSAAQEAVSELRQRREAQEAEQQPETEDEVQVLMQAYIDKHPNKIHGGLVAVDLDTPEGAAVLRAVSKAGIQSTPLQSLIDSIFAARSTRH